MATMFFGFVFFGLLHGLFLLPLMLIAAADLQDAVAGTPRRS
jgi:hypothetical protein